MAIAAAAAASPLTAVVWVFAGSTVILATLTITTLCLAFRHRGRRRNGTYARILAETSSSRILHVLTVSDLLADTSLQGPLQQRLEGKAHKEAKRQAPEEETGQQTSGEETGQQRREKRRRESF